jgi:redox-sensitive bicupin YhaK (pirin superfamily)
MAVLALDETVTLASGGGAVVMLLGGEKLDGERFIEWNFVSSSREKIEKAKHDWTNQEMGHVPGETEWIPLPERKPH